MSGDGARGELIRTERLTKVYPGRVRAVDGLDLAVAEGELVGFLGPNGAGKTTAVQLLLGALRPTEGRAEVLGRPAGDRAARQHLGYLPEQFQFPGFLTPPALLDFHGRLLGLPSDERRGRSRELIGLVGLEEAAGRPLKTFSKGMLQRVGLAQALLGRPRLLLLDEPTSGLDPIGIRNVRNLLLWVKEQGVSVLLNSHLLSEVELVCDRVAILARGRVVAEGRIDELLRPVSSVQVRARELSEEGLARMRAVVGDVEAQQDGWFVARVDRPDQVPELARTVVESGAQLEALLPTYETLEEAFVRLVGPPPPGADGRGGWGSSWTGPDGKPVGPTWGAPAGR